MLYNPNDWYWKADDGRIFSSARGIIIPGEDDAAFVAWKLNDTRMPIRWPPDANGNQTLASLQEVLPQGLYVGLEAYAANKRWERETNGIMVGGLMVATDDRSKQMIMGARIAAEADANFTTPWVGEDGTIVELTAAQVIGVSNAVLLHVQGCFAIFATVKAGIDNQTITTREQVDAAFEA